MINVRGNKVYFTGKDAVRFKAAAKELGLTVQDTLTGLLWEKIMSLAREGLFLRVKAGKK